jgi:RNA polymerase sigma-70 factor (ECF subfamily)
MSSSGSSGGAGRLGPGPGQRLPSEGEIEELRRRLVGAVARTCPVWLREEVEDIVQVVLARLADTLRKSECPREFSSMYLSKAARGAAVDEIRRRYRRREIPPGALRPLEQERSRAPDPERESVSRDLGRGIRECLGRLREARRLAVTLYLRGCSARESARRLGWSLRRVENLVFRGLRDMRECLSRKGLSP